MFESKYRTTNKWLTKFVTEVRSTIRRFNQDLFRSLIQPFAYRKDIFPFTTFVCTWVWSHINSSSRNRPWTFTTAHTVTDFSSCTCRSTIKWFYGCREVVCLCFQRDNCFYIFDDEIIGSWVILWSKLFYYRTFSKCHIIFVGRNDFVRIFLSGFFDHLEKWWFHFLSVDDKCSTKYFVAAVFWVDLCKSENFRVCQFSTQVFFYFQQIVHFFTWKCKTFLFVIFF